jgi:hypothetical protein
MQDLEAEPTIAMKYKCESAANFAAPYAMRIGSYSVQRRKTNDPFVPPNPNEFDSAYSAWIFCGLFGT